MIPGFFNIPWFAWAGLSILVAAVYSVVWPRGRVVTRSGVRFITVRWGHTLAWILLAVNFLLRGITPDLNGTSNIFAIAGGLVYGLFMYTSFRMK